MVDYKKLNEDMSYVRRKIPYFFHINIHDTENAIAWGNTAIYHLQQNMIQFVNDRRFQDAIYQFNRPRLESVLGDRAWYSQDRTLIDIYELVQTQPNLNVEVYKCRFLCAIAKQALDGYVAINSNSQEISISKSKKNIINLLSEKLVRRFDQIATRR